jgi:superfamily II DNA helicase RecQ
LNELGTSARQVNSTLTEAELTEVMKEIGAGALEFVFVTPERLEDRGFMETPETYLAPPEALNFEL